MMKKTILATLAVCALGLCRSLWAVDIANASSGPVVPGEWNTSFTATKAYAEQNKIPLLVLWSSPGCGYCNKMKTACNTDAFVSWRKEKKIVLLISEGDMTAKSFAVNDAKKFPYMRLYWPAGKVDVKFTGRSSYIPASGSTLEAQLISYLDSLLVNWSPSGSYEGGDTPTPTPTPPKPVIGDEWKRARKLYGTAKTADGRVAGRVIVAAGKVNAKKGTAKVKVQILNLAGKVKTLGTKDFTVDKTTSGTVSSGVGSAAIDITGSSVAGTITYDGEVCDVSARAPGGSLKDGTLYFMLDDSIESWQGGTVIGGDAFLPLQQEFTTKGSRWTFPRKGSLSYNRKANVYVMSATDNPSGLKMAYSPTTGYAKGSFTIFTRVGAKTTIKRVTATVGGFMVGGEGDGLVSIKNVGVSGFRIGSELPVSVNEAEK